MAPPSIAWHGLIYGAERMDEGRQRSYLLEYLCEVVQPSMPILPYDAAAAQWHGQARSALEKEGLSTAFADGQIAGIAGVEGLNVVTENISDFEPFANREEIGVLEETPLESGVRVENWFEP